MTISKPRKSQIRWTTREWNLIASWLVDQGVDTNRHGFRTWVVDAMKAVLPKERWRDEVNLSGVKDIIRPLMAECVRIRNIPEPSIPEPAVHTASIGDFSDEQLLTEVMKRIKAVVKGCIREEMENIALSKLNVYGPLTTGVPAPKHNPEPISEQHSERRKVLCVGPRGVQPSFLTKKFPSLDLRFVASDERPSLVRDRGLGVSVIVLWTNFMSHSHQCVAISTHVKTIYATGGMDSVEECLRRIAVGEA